MKEDYKIAKNQLISLYQKIKVRKNEGSDHKSNNSLQRETENLYQLPLKTIAGYIASSIDTILSMKQDANKHLSKDPLINDDVNAAREYETLLRKEEGIIRNNISVINQLKLSLENYITEFELLKRENSILKEKMKKDKYNKTRITEDLIGLNINEEIASMKKKLHQYEEQSLQSLKQEKNLKLQLLEKNKEIQRLEIINHNPPNANCNYIKRETNDNSEFNKELKRNSSLIVQSQSKLKAIRKNIDESSANNNNNNGNHYNKVFSQDKPFVLTRKQDEHRGSDFSDTQFTRNKQNSHNHPQCRSISLIRERTSEEMSLIMKRNEQKTQRIHEATIKELMNQEKRKAMSLKLIRQGQAKKKLILPITLDQRTKNTVSVMGSIEMNKKEMSLNNNNNHTNRPESKRVRFSMKKR